MTCLMVAGAPCANAGYVTRRSNYRMSYTRDDEGVTAHQPPRLLEEMPHPSSSALFRTAPLSALVASNA